MQYALVNGEKREASRGLIGVCQSCDQLMIPKCGPIKAPHWAHKSEARCDPWWEKETPWHRAWKELFPEGWREVRQHDATGERHIADVRTEHGLVIECQHSSISAVEVAAREKFYLSVGTMVWLVDGARYKAGLPKLVESQKWWGKTGKKRVFSTDRPEKSFPRSWLNCSVPVIFDFSGASEQNGGVHKFWCLLPGRARGRAVVAAVSRRWLVEKAKTKSELVQCERILAEVAEFEGRIEILANQASQARQRIERMDPALRAWTERRYRWSNRLPRRRTARF